MTLSQVHYTSAPPGPDGSGFRFTAVTPGVSQSLLREAEPLIGYEPPRDAPPRPTTAELDSFPRAFSHSLLSDGSRLLARTVYTGADYSGRWGNFHAHAVHLPQGTCLPGGALPITAWEAAQWADRTPDGRPAPLEALVPAGRFQRDTLLRFATARAPWIAGYFADLHRQHEDPAAPQIVLVERDSADVARWIALASAVLPREQAHQITFTTYTRRPQLARQQIIGVLPDDARGVLGQGHRYRVHDCSGDPPAGEPVPDSWAEVAASVWLSGAPELFKQAAALPGGDPFDAGPLAAAGLCAGIELGPVGRTAAADWAARHATTLGGEWLLRFTEALCAPGADRPAAESTALARLLAALEPGAPPATTAPLAALVLTTAVRLPDRLQLPCLRPSALTGDLRRRLAMDLAPQLRDGIAGDEAEPDGPATERAVELLRVADLLGVGCRDLLPGLAWRLARAVLADPDLARAPVVRRAVEERFELRAALLDKLDGLAAGDPPAAALLMARAALPFTAEQPLPHLRMCDEANRLGTEDRITSLHSVLRACGVSPFAEPLVLRTAVRLVWDGAAPTAAEGRLLLGETGSDAHRTAGTWRELIRAALESPADDQDAPELARDLLRSFSEELAPRERGALLLLEFAGDLREGAAGARWTDRAVSLRAVAEPVPAGVLEQAYRAVAERLLGEEVPADELSALTRSGDAELLAAYDRAARSKRTADRLRVVPAYAAACYVAWSAHPGAGRAWEGVRTGLLDKVLRPVVRALPEEDITALEGFLREEGARWVAEFRSWNRPGAFGRFGRRFGGRGRRSDAEAPRWGDVEPPRKDGRPS